MEEDDLLGEVMVDDGNLSFEDIETEISGLVSDARNFITTHQAPNWEEAQYYYNGGSKLKKIDGRSQVVATKVRDAVRGARPSLLRIFFQSDDIVEYVPNGHTSAPIAAQQTAYVNNLFQQAGGYKLLYPAIHNALLKRLGVVKYWWDERNTPKKYAFTGLSTPEVQQLYNVPNVEITAISEKVVGLGPQGPVLAFDVECVETLVSGEIKIVHVPLHEFFIDEHATCLEDARIYGHTSELRKGDAIAMGLPQDLIEDLDTEDQEAAVAQGEADLRRNYTTTAETASVDVMMQNVLITEAYGRLDIDGTGVPQLYRFWLGGSKFELLDYEPVEVPHFALFPVDPEPDTVFGKSVFDILHHEQDTSTSILRATIDNAHLSNNRRLAVHETLVNLEDVMSPKIGAPIRTRAAGQIQEIGTQSTIGSMLPLMQYIDQDSENKVGVTKAAMGLDPDALQSTDKDAVRNTIQLSQGQIETMARNIAEFGLKDLFAGLLKLSMWHMDRKQVVQIAGSLVPIDQAMFDPLLKMRVKVGLGTGSPEMKAGALQGVLAQQMGIIEKMGPSNPIVTPAHVYNTMEDIAKLAGINDISRYFSPATPELQQQLAQMQQQQAQAAEANRPLDPSKAMIEIENIKSKTKLQTEQLQVVAQQRADAITEQLRALEIELDDDFRRDQLAQQREIEDSRARKASSTPVPHEKIKQEQNAPRDNITALNGGR